MSRLVAAMSALIVVMCSVIAFAAPSPQLRQCVQNNNASHAQVWQMFIQARNRGNISPAEQQQFRAMEQRLNAIKQNLSRGGLTLPECQRISQEIARERATVQRMAATPAQNPQLRQCVQNNNASHAQVWQMFIQARNRGNISPAEQQQFRAMEQRLNAIKQNLSRGGLTLPECQRISQEIARERATVQRMAATRR
ncbi:MAG TPA: hypothetical protein PL053_06400 [Deltaproteobacteria bacterium]|nr:hypothetical protein [Deltaproteobacteria bacterium]